VHRPRAERDERDRGAGGESESHGGRPHDRPQPRPPPDDNGAVDPSAAAARFRPGFGGHTGHYVYANATRPHLPAWALALALGAAVAFVWLAGGGLARRAAPGRA